MLDKLKKFLQPAAQAELKKETQMVTETLSGASTVEELTASLEALQVESATTVATLASTLTKLAETEAAFAALVVSNETAAALAKEQKLSARKASVVTALGTERANALMTATNDVSDSQFAAIVAAMTVAGQVEATSDLFVEVGVDAQADAAAVLAAVKSNPVMDYLKNKFQPEAV